MKFCETWLAAAIFESPIWLALIMQVPIFKIVIVLPESPEVVQMLGDPEVNTTVRDAEEEAETVKVSLE